MPRWGHRRRDLEHENARLRARITDLEKQLTVLKAQQIIEVALGIPSDAAVPSEPSPVPAPKRTKRHLGVYDGANAVILAVLAGLAAAVAAVRHNTARVALSSATATVVAAALVITFAGGGHHGSASSIALQPRTTTSPTTRQPATHGPTVGSPTPEAAIVAPTENPVLLRVGASSPEGATAPNTSSPTPPITEPSPSPPPPTQTPVTVPPPPSDPPPSTSPPVVNPPQQCVTLNPLLAVCVSQLLIVQL